jgi:hypothetical protein
MQAIDDFVEYGVWIGSLQEKLAGQACPFIRRLVVGPLEQSDTAAATRSRVFGSRSHQPLMMSPATASIGFLPNRDGSFSSPHDDLGARWPAFRSQRPVSASITAALAELLGELRS